MIIIAFAIAMPYLGFAQDSKLEEVTTESLFSKIALNNVFQQLNIDKVSPVANSLGVDLEDSKISFTGVGVLDDKHMLVVNGSGGVSDGVYALFSNSKLSPKVSLDVQYVFLMGHGKSQYYYSSQLEYEKKKTSNLR